MEFSAKQIAEYIQGIIVGDENATVHTFAKIEEGVPGAISFLSNPKYTHYIYDTQSTIVLVNKDFVPEQEVKATLIKVDNAYESLAILLTLYEMSKPKKSKMKKHKFSSVTSQAPGLLVCKKRTFPKKRSLISGMLILIISTGIIYPVRTKQRLEIENPAAFASDFS